MGQPPTEQPEPDRTDSKSQSIAGWFLWPVIGVLIYVLSVGPACKLSQAGFLPFSTFRIIYAPISAVTVHFPGARRCMIRYLRLWGAFVPDVEAFAPAAPFA